MFTPAPPAPNHHKRQERFQMADDATASVIPLHQGPRKKRAKAGAGRAKTHRQRKQQKPKTLASADEAKSSSSELLISQEFLSVELENTAQGVIEPAVTHPVATSQAAPLSRSQRQVAPVLLSLAAITLAAVGIAIRLVCPLPRLQPYGGMALPSHRCRR